MVHKTLALLIVSMGVNAASAYAAPPLAYTPPPCVSTGGSARITATLPDANAQSARLYFRTASDSADYYLDMVKTGSQVWAVLPAVAAGTTSIVHRIVVTGADGVPVSTEAAPVAVDAACPTSALKGEEISFANNLVIGLTESTQPAIPAGFSCAGITGEITADGVMKPLVACTQQVAGHNPKSATRLVKALHSPVVLGILGAAASGIVLSSNSNSSTRPISSARP
jgi:hypothetical protein